MDEEYDDYCNKLNKQNQLIEDTIIVYSTLEGRVPIPPLNVIPSKEEYITNKKLENLFNNEKIFENNLLTWIKNWIKYGKY